MNRERKQKILTKLANVRLRLAELTASKNPNIVSYIAGRKKRLEQAANQTKRGRGTRKTQLTQDVGARSRGGGTSARSAAVNEANRLRRLSTSDRAFNIHHL